MIKKTDIYFGSIQKSLQGIKEILVSLSDECLSLASTAEDVQENPSTFPFPDMFDKDLDEIISENQYVYQILDRAIQHIDLAVSALDEID